MSKAAFFAPMTDCSMAEADASMAFTETRPPLASKTKDGNEAFNEDKRNSTKTVGQSRAVVNNLGNRPHWRYTSNTDGRNR